MACSIDGTNVATKGWTYYMKATGLIDLNGAKDNSVKTEETTSVNEIPGTRYKEANTVELSLAGTFESVVAFEVAVFWVLGTLVQAGQHTIIIESETLTGIMAAGATVKQHQRGPIDLEIESAYFGSQTVVGEMTIKILRNG